MKEISLSKGKIAIVDDNDFDYLNQWLWFYYKKPDRNTGYAVREIKLKTGARSLVRMHRIIMGAMTGEIIDHRNGNGIDNQKTNLRRCSDTQNKYNSKIRKHNTSGFKGVSLDRNNHRNMWVASIRVNGVSKHLGSYPTKQKAAIAYNEAALKYHRDFARINEDVSV